MTRRRPPTFSRRHLLLGGAAFTSATFSSASRAAARTATAQRPAPGASRATDAYRVRMAAAALSRDLGAAPSRDNGDERELSQYVGMYSKGLPHNGLGEVDANAYALLLSAIETRSPRAFDMIPCPGTTKLTNPQGGFSYNLVGPDPSAIACPPPPRFGSAEQGAEMVELYWQAQLRDVPFVEYERHPVVARAAAEVGRLRETATSPSAVFRAGNRGCLAGPYLSQFLLKELWYSPLPVIQKIRPAPARGDYLGEYDRWLDVQNGAAAPPAALENIRCYVRNGRDLAEYVHRDFTYQAALSAALILLKIGAPANAGNPYLTSRNQSGFTTFGPPYVLYLIAVASQAALTACWFQKWMVHRRLRPEEMAGRIANQLAKRASYPLHSSVLDSDALATTLRTRSTALLTSSYPEGAPTHPAFPAGHAVISAAGTTVLKALFDESFVIPEPFVCNPDGQSLKRYDGPPLMLGGELDKLATNIAMGRCFAGIHWRSDVEEGLRLGEEVAIRILREVRLTLPEPFPELQFHRLDGGLVTV